MSRRCKWGAHRHAGEGSTHEGGTRVVRGWYGGGPRWYEGGTSVVRSLWPDRAHAVERGQVPLPSSLSPSLPCLTLLMLSSEVRSEQLSESCTLDDGRTDWFLSARGGNPRIETERAAMDGRCMRPGERGAQQQHRLVRTHALFAGIWSGQVLSRQREGRGWTLTGPRMWGGTGRLSWHKAADDPYAWRVVWAFG